MDNWLNDYDTGTGGTGKEPTGDLYRSYGTSDEGVLALRKRGSPYDNDFAKYLLGYGLLGRAPYRAGGDAWNTFHGPGASDI